MLFTKNPIKKRVLSVIKERIAKAETEYEQGCISIDERCEREKEQLADKLVDDLTGKFM